MAFWHNGKQVKWVEVSEEGFAEDDLVKHSKLDGPIMMVACLDPYGRVETTWFDRNNVMQRESFDPRHITKIT